MTKFAILKMILIICFAFGLGFMPDSLIKEFLVSFLAGVGVASIVIFSLDTYQLTRNADRD